MQRENERSCYKKSLSSPKVWRPAEFGDLQRTRRFVMKQQTTCVEDSRVLAGRANSGMTGLFYHGNSAFTLIELLVVVLIIGILAAVAVPQYQKAVDKSRMTQLLTALKSVKQAEEVYYLANGVYTTSWDELDIGFEGTVSGAYLTTPQGFRLLLRLAGAEGTTVSAVDGFDDKITGLNEVTAAFSHSGVAGQDDVLICKAEKDSVRANQSCKSVTGDVAGTPKGQLRFYYMLF